MDALQTTKRAQAFGERGNLLAEALLETLWPTRCAVCDEPGAALCERCRHALPYIDWWQACPRCGAPFGLTQCCGCNPITLEAAHRTSLPYAQARSAVVLTEETRRMVIAYKDRGERSLAGVMGAIMANLVPPEWRKGAVSFVPASASAQRRRGFDHAELLAEETARLLDLPCIPLLQRPRSRDQRALSRKARICNMQDVMVALPGATMPSAVVVIDDVYTTGSTLFAASDALRKAGGKTIRCITFARAW